RTRRRAARPWWIWVTPGFGAGGKPRLGPAKSSGTSGSAWPACGTSRSTSTRTTLRPCGERSRPGGNFDGDDRPAGGVARVAGGQGTYGRRYGVDRDPGPSPAADDPPPPALG